MLEKAILIATIAHKGQIDKGGAPYIMHLIRVMNAGNTENEKICGILHDLIEDTEWTFQKLKEEGFDDEIIEETLKKSGITDKEMEHFEKISKAKLDKFYKYFEEEIKEEIKDSDYGEKVIEIEIKKVNGKWQIDFDYNNLINEMLKGLEDSFKSMKNDIDD
mgnify:CR=1 FL=1